MQKEIQVIITFANINNISSIVLSFLPSETIYDIKIKISEHLKNINNMFKSNIRLIYIHKLLQNNEIITNILKDGEILKCFIKTI
jgi:hypothetical protein